MPATKKVPATVEVPAEAINTAASPADELYFDAQEGKKDLTLIPEGKAKKNHTVEVVLHEGKPVVRGGMVVVRLK